jgi:Domain of unknown function (DUF4349)
MKIQSLIVIVFAVLFLTACDEFPSTNQENAKMFSDMPSSSLLETDAFVVEPPSVNSVVSDKRKLAYRYQFSFAIPSKTLESVSQKVVQDCKKAGPDNCLIVRSSVDRYRNDQVTANIALRVQPKWFADYQDDLTSSSIAAGGKLMSSSVSVKDLTIAISDSTVKLSTLHTLRTRLQTMLGTKGSTVKDLVAVERELARVQGEIEGITARLRVLQTRIRMSEVELEFETRASAASRSSFQPVIDAITGFFSTLSTGLANLINFIAYVLPWLFLIAPIVWMLALWRRRLKNKA